ncbi:MAG: hypothetical protein V2A70_10685 [Candidatus Omnitrophota bacterium]
MRTNVLLLSIFILAVSTGGCSQNTSGTAANGKAPAAVTVAATTVQPQSNMSSVVFAPFYVYQDKNSKNRFIPSGYMPTGDCVNVDDAWQYDVKEGRSCIRIIYDVVCSKEGHKWAGVYWQNPADNWGARKGGYNLTGATKLVFWAKGEMGGERIEEFRVGGMGAGQMYPDSDSTGIGPVILTKEWKEYTIDLRGKDLSYISGGFSWFTNVDVNPHHCTFYLDGIRYE